MCRVQSTWAAGAMPCEWYQVNWVDGDDDSVADLPLALQDDLNWPGCIIFIGRRG